MLVAATSTARAADFDDCRRCDIDLHLETDRTGGNRRVALEMVMEVIGTAVGISYGYAKDGRPILTKDLKLLLNDNNGGKPEGIHLMIGRRPYAAFVNSTGDRQMLEYTHAGDEPRLSMIVLHDDAKREYGYGPAQGLPDTKVGSFTQALYDEAKNKGWTVISMKEDWNRIFAFNEAGSRALQ